MTSSPAAIVRGYFYETFYRLPPRWRRRLVRLASAKYTVGAVVLVRPVGADADQLVLLRQPTGRGWSLPAGLLKRNEPAVVGAARELQEETGLRVAPEQLRPASPTAVVHTNGRWVDVVFEARVPIDAPLIVDGHEVLEARWHRLDALPPLSTATAGLLGHYGIGPRARPAGGATSTPPRSGNPVADASAAPGGATRPEDPAEAPGGATGPEDPAEAPGRAARPEDPATAPGGAIRPEDPATAPAVVEPGAGPADVEP